MKDLSGVDTYDLIFGLPMVSTVNVRFDESIPPRAQGESLLAFEKHLRNLTGMDVRVFKDKMGDDSKLRIRMTPQERDKL